MCAPLFGCPRSKRKTLAVLIASASAWSESALARGRIEKFSVMPRAMRLLAIRHPERPGERRGVRARQHRQRGETLRMTIRDKPGEAAAPIMADQMKASLTMAGGVGDVEGIAGQPVDAIVVKVFRIGPRVDRIAALVGRYCMITRRRQCRHLIVPEVS